MSDYLSMGDVRTMTQAFRTAVQDNDSGAIEAAGLALVEKLESLPDGTEELVSDDAYFTLRRGSMLGSSAVERGRSHIAMGIAGINDTSLSDSVEESRDAVAFHMAATIGDLFTLADEYKIDIMAMLGKAQDCRAENY